MTKTVTTVDLLRHGEPVGGRKYRGQIDDPLSERGWQQMRDATAGAVPWTAISSSPLLRCAEFARELGHRLEVPVQLDDRLKEIGFGEWEGYTADQLTRNDPARLVRFWTDPESNRPAGAETLQAFGQRVTSAWHDHLERHRGAHTLIVSHAGVMRMILARVLGMPAAHLFRTQVPSAGLSRIEVLEQEGHRLTRLVFHGRSGLDP